MALQRTYVSWPRWFICWFIKTVHFRLVFDGGQGRRENMVILEAMLQIALFWELSQHQDLFRVMPSSDYFKANISASITVRTNLGEDHQWMLKSTEWKENNTYSQNRTFWLLTSYKGKKVPLQWESWQELINFQTENCKLVYKWDIFLVTGDTWSAYPTQ